MIDERGAAGARRLDGADQRRQLDRLGVERAVELPPDRSRISTKLRGASAAAACRAPAPSTDGCGRRRSRGGSVALHQAGVRPPSAATMARTSSSETLMRRASGQARWAERTSLSPLPETMCSTVSVGLTISSAMARNRPGDAGDAGRLAEDAGVLRQLVHGRQDLLVLDGDHGAARLADRAQRLGLVARLPHGDRVGERLGRGAAAPSRRRPGTPRRSAARPRPARRAGAAACR